MVTFLAGGTGTPKLLDGATRVWHPDEIAVGRQHGRRYRTRRPPRLPRRRHRAVRGWRRPRPRDVVGIADDTTTTEELRRLATQVGLGTSPDTSTIRRRRPAARSPGGGALSGVGEFMEIGDRDRAVHLTRTSLLDGAHAHGGDPNPRGRLRPRRRPPPDVRRSGRDADPHRGGRDDPLPGVLGRAPRGPAVADVEFRGAADAEPTAVVRDALAEPVVIGPSNPVTSIGPMLAIPGVEAALSATPWSPSRRSSATRSSRVRPPT